MAVVSEREQGAVSRKFFQFVSETDSPPRAAPVNISFKFKVIDLGATNSAVPAAMAMSTKLEITIMQNESLAGSCIQCGGLIFSLGKSRTLGNFRDIGIALTST